MAEWIKVGKVDEVAPGEAKRCMVEDEPVAVVNLNGEFYAIHDTCTHAEASLSEGELEGEELVCWRHGAHFNVKTGAATAPAFQPARIYEVRVEGGEIFVKAE